MNFSETEFLPRERLQSLIELLAGMGYDVIGPTIRQDAVVLDHVRDARQLPAGWSDTQEAAVYQIHSTGGERQFNFNVGPTSWKRFLFPPETSIGGAWLDYDWADPVSKKVMAKTTFARAQPNGDGFVGVGVYR